MFLPAAVSAAWAAVILAVKRRPTRAQMLLSQAMLLVAFSMAMLTVFFRGQAGSLFIYDYIFELTAMLCGPLYYLSICSLTEPRGATLRQRRVFVVPLMYIAVLTVGAFWLGPRQYELQCWMLREGEQMYLPSHPAWNFMMVWSHIVFVAMMMAMNFVLVLMAWRKSRIYQRRFNSFYATGINAKQIDSRPLQLLAWLFLPLCIAVVLVVEVRPLYYKYYLIVIALLLSVIQTLMGYYTYHLDHDARYLALLVKGGLTPVLSSEPYSNATGILSSPQGEGSRNQMREIKEDKGR